MTKLWVRARVSFWLLAPLLVIAAGCNGRRGPEADEVVVIRRPLILINATFDSGSSGFVYADDVFGTNVPSGASGVASGGQLHVTLGQAPNSGANSGGWRATFTATGPVAVSFFYALRHADVFEAPECAEVRATIDGTAYGTGGNPYIVRICDGGNTSGTFSFTSNSLPAGTHTLTIGGYLNSNSFSDEISSFDFDNVVVDGNSGTPSCGDMACNGTETCSTCPGDCGACPPPTGPFLESGGMVVMEAESFFANVSQGGHSWTSDTTGTPSGGQARRATPNSGVARDTGYVTMSPRLDFRVSFTQTGTYNVWVRGRDPGPSVGSNDSVHAGLDGAAVTSADRMNGWTSSFAWRRSTLDGVNATMPVTTAGLHTINFWMREDGFAIDKVLLTTNASFTPTGTGPAQSPRGGACGDGSCSGGETCTSCAADCGACPPACPDGTCNGTETCSTCPSDCGACPPACPDGTCNGSETCSTCPSDCGACPPACPDGTCNGTETCSTCPSDCGVCAPVCPDGTCNGTENCTTCAADCGACPASGLDSRPPNPTCVAPPPLATGFALNRAWPNLTFSEPLGIVQAPADNAWFYVIEKTGRLRAIPSNNAATPAQTRVFLDLSAVVAAESEGGLLGVAFHPSYATNRFVYVSYTINVAGTFTSRLSRFTSTDGGQTLNLSSQVVLLSHPKTMTNHNGGNIAFGADGLLYMSLGDDAYQNPTRALMAADPNTWFGKVLRVDVNSGSPYAIPPSNPFAGGGGRPEVYAYGFRNPWRFTFDRTTGALWLADVGEDTWEEVDRVQSGGFYGWPHREADLCRPTGNCSLSYLSPEFVYPHAGPASITGGYVYRGAAIPQLQGKYVYGDFITGEVWTYDLVSRQIASIDVGGGTLSAWGQDNGGELYAVRYSAGIIERLEAATGGGPTDFPTLITDTGCFNAANPTAVVAGAIPYSIAVPFWSDGADKERYLALPNGTTINIDSSGDWVLPPGGVTIKHFRHQGQLFETRFFVRHSNGSYAGYTYEWNSGQTQATLVPPGGKNRSLPDLEWTYPSRSGCFACHTDAAGSSLGIETPQLNIDSFYPTTGRTSNQLVTLDTIGMLSGNRSSMAPLPASNGTAPVQDRAKAYLHVNCSNCHRPGGPGRGTFDARFATAFGSMQLCNAPPTLGDLGVPGAMLVKPTDHAGSVIWMRMSQRTANFMPPLASSIADAAGAALLAQWIDGLTSCPAPPPSLCTVAGNRVANCDFASGQTAPWTLRLGPGGAGSASVVGGELRLDVSNPGTLDWHVQDIQILGSLPAGNYQISFDARAASARSIVVNLGEELEDYTSFCQQSVALTTTTTRYTINCPSLAGDDNVKLDFNVGNPGTASVFIDNVYFGPPR